MCTAITLHSGDHYFGRNLDLECAYCERVTVTPRSFPFVFRRMGAMTTHFAMIGMAYVRDGYPLYYDATNEKGLSMAGLNFPGNAVYRPEAADRDNIAPFEFIPWVLGQCATLDDARKLLSRINMAEIHFSPDLPLSPLHWIVADRDGAITVESVADGLKVYDNPVGVLTNNPPFDYQMFNLNNYMGVGRRAPRNRFSDMLALEPYGRGMGGIGLPGDLSPMSRFVRAAFAKLNSACGDEEVQAVNQFFHILDFVAHPRGCVQAEDGGYEITVYSSCCNADTGVYYYKTYENSRITGVDIHREDLDGTALVAYPLEHEEAFRIQNG